MFSGPPTVPLYPMTQSSHLYPNIYVFIHRKGNCQTIWYFGAPELCYITLHQEFHFHFRFLSIQLFTVVFKVRVTQSSHTKRSLCHSLVCIQREQFTYVLFGCVLFLFRKVISDFIMEKGIWFKSELLYSPEFFKHRRPQTPTLKTRV